MSLRKFIQKLEEEGKLLRIKEEHAPELEIPRILKEKDGKTILFENVRNSGYKVVGGVCSSRENFALALGIKKEELLLRIDKAIRNPSKPEIVDKAPCQEIVEKDVDLSKIPILTLTSKDMGPYITAGVFIATDSDYGPNMSFHRASPISKGNLVARICQRDLHNYLERTSGELDIAICIGLHPSILLAAATSIEPSINEMTIANSLKPLNLVKCKTNSLLVPAEAELILEGKITKEKHEEGPFPDITRTYDITRQEPVIQINCITHRKNPIYQTLLPGSAEHELLMGMPKEPVIYNKVSKVCSCKNVLLTHGGCSWLHGVIQIDKKNSEDGKKAIEEAFKAHKSLKHLVIVDKDIDIYNPEEVEWAIATRFQGDKDVIAFREPGSSLDPSAEEDRSTCKMGLDATIPWDKKRESFEKARLGK